MRAVGNYIYFEAFSRAMSKRRRENITEMQERHQREVAKLRKLCEHPASDRSKWMAEYWGPAHSTGHTVQVCGLCGEVVGRTCCQCGKRIYSWLKGLAYEEDTEPYELPDGRTVRKVTNANDVTLVFCKKCWRERYYGKNIVPWGRKEDGE